MAEQSTIGVTERGDAALDTSWSTWVGCGHAAILISKDPMKLYGVLQNYKSINVIVHATITGFGSTFLEPNVPIPEEAYEGYLKLIDLLGIERVVLRTDPVIPTEQGINTALQIISQTKGRVRISFFDYYDHVKERMRDTPLPWDSFHAPLELRKKAWEVLGKPEICGEPDFECTGCVSKLDCEVLGVTPKDISGRQRPTCACLTNKRELLTKRAQCPHRCIYCYWRQND